MALNLYCFFVELFAVQIVSIAKVLSELSDCIGIVRVYELILPFEKLPPSRGRISPAEDTTEYQSAAPRRVRVFIVVRESRVGRMQFREE